MIINLVKLTSKNNEPEDTCRSWLEHWEEEKGFNANRCSLCQAYANHYALIGGLARKMGKSDKTTYVIPICKSCSRNVSITDSFDVNDADLVSTKIEH